MWLDKYSKIAAFPAKIRNQAEVGRILRQAFGKDFTPDILFSVRPKEYVPSQVHNISPPFYLVTLPHDYNRLSIPFLNDDDSYTQYWHEFT